MSDLNRQPNRWRNLEIFLCD